MAITIFLPTVLAPFTSGERTLETTAPTLGEAVSDVGERYPGLLSRLADPEGRPYPFVTFYVNDEDIRFLSGFQTALSEGDEITIVPAVAGG